jgi:ankyrin repeat protein
MENKEDLLRLTQTARKQSELEEKTPKAMWYLLKSLASNRLREAQRVLATGYDPNFIINLNDERTPEEFRKYGQKEGWIVHDEITVLGISAYMNDETSTLWLIENGVMVDVPFDNGRDALWLAMAKSSLKVMSLLYEHGADLYWSLPREDNINRLIFAVNLSSVENVGWLKLKGHDLHTRDAYGRTALHHNLMQNPYTEKDQRITEILLSDNLSPNDEDDLGMPAHGYASEEALKFLHDKGITKLKEISFEAEHNVQKWVEKKQQKQIQENARKMAPHQRIKFTKGMPFKPKVMGS